MLVFKLITLLLLAGLLSACVAVQPFPNAGRSGDTITLAVGSPDGMTKANTSVTFTSDDPLFPDTINITAGVRQVFKIFPDKTSEAWLMSSASSLATRSGHGPWLTIVAIDLPPGLPEGPGIIRVFTPGGLFTTLHPDVNGTSIAFNVLPGTGNANPLTYLNSPFGTTDDGDLDILKPAYQALVKFPIVDNSQPIYGAIQVKLNVSIIDFFGNEVLDEGIRVVMDSMPIHEKSQISRIWSRTGDDYTIIFTSPGGMHTYEPRFSIVPLFPTYPYEFDISIPPSITSIKYYDLDGFEITGPLPTITII